MSENQAPKSEEGIVALDPGVRCFQTLYMYAPNHGYVMEWGAYILIFISTTFIKQSLRCTCMYFRKRRRQGTP